MRIVSDNIKNALKQPTTQRKGRILVNGNYYEVYNVEYYADAYEDGNVIGNAIASQLDFDLPYMDKFDSFKYFDGVWTGNEYEYVDMGTFTVFDEQDEDEFNKHITAFDNLINFNKPFEEKGTYPKTLYKELQNVCQQANVELVNTSIPNGNFEVENNQFVNGETLKTVLKAICQISGNYGIIKEDKLVLQLTNDTGETILKNQHEPVVWKRKTYGINQVILQLGDVEGEYVIRQDDEDIAENGVHKLVITNNPFAYTQDKRDALIDELFNQVHGLGYIPFEMNCEWLNYLEIGDKIINDDIETIVLRIRGKSPRSLESMISAPAIIDSAVEYVNNANSIKNQINRTEIIVDKQNQEIELIASKTEETTKTLKTEKSVESNGEEIYIEDSGGYDLEKLRIDGKSTQNGTPTPDAPVEIESVGFTNLIPTNESEWEQGTINGGNNEDSTTRLRTKNYIEINDDTLHTFRLENALIGNVWFYDEQKQVVNNLYDMIYKTGMKSVEFTTPKNTKYYKVVIRYEDNSVITSQAISEIKPMLEKGSIAHSCIPFGKYGIEVKTVGKNLFDKNNAITGYYDDVGSIKVSDNWSISQIKVAPNENYVISGNNVNNTSATIVLLDSNKNTISVVGGYKNVSSFTTTSNTSYVGVSVGNYKDSRGSDLETFQLEKGSIITEYEPYKENISVLQLNAPLRSLPNGVKDIAYIKNNKLYVDRYVGSLTLNGSESWSVANSLSNNLLLQIEMTNLADLQSVNGIISDHFIGTTGDFIFNANDGKYYIAGNSSNKIRISLNKTEFPTMSSFTNWLETNNVQVDYALATPVTEEIGFVSIPTFENINHINLYGKISTSFEITYLTNSHLNEQFATKSEIKITNDEINILSKKIQPVSNTIKKTGEIQLENAHEGILHKLIITGNISLIYPSNDLYPSDNLYPKIFKLQVDEKIYELDLDCLNYINSNIYDEFVYENSKCYVIRRIGIDENGELYQLENEIIETKKDLIINVLENSKITLLGFDNAILTAEYLLQNQYTDVFATEAYVNSEIKQTADEINIEVAKKVNDDEVVNKINVSTEKVLLKGNRVVIESDNFNLNADGKITATAGKVGGFEMDNQSFSKELNGIYNYNYFDTILTAIAILKRISIDSNLSEVLDVNNDNNITAVDYSVIKNIIKGESENNKFLKGLFEINSSDPKNCISIKDELGEVIASLGLGGINSTYVTCNNFVCGYPSESAGEFIGTTINGETGNVTCVSLTQTSQEKYKKNFEKLENALDIVKQTDIYQYHLKNQHDEEKKHIGFVIGENYNYSQEITSPNNDGADIYSMVSVCFKAIQEQQEQIKMLKNEINQLKEMIK